MERGGPSLCSISVHSQHPLVYNAIGKWKEVKILFQVLQRQGTVENEGRLPPLWTSGTFGNIPYGTPLGSWRGFGWWTLTQCPHFVGIDQEISFFSPKGFPLESPNKLGVNLDIKKKHQTQPPGGANLSWACKLSDHKSILFTLINFPSVLHVCL